MNTNTDPRYPDITVQLSGNDGNAFSIIARISKALRRGEVPAEEIAMYQAESRSGDYDNVLTTAMRWVNVE